MARGNFGRSEQHREAGKKGGDALKSKDYDFSKLGRKGGASTLKKFGPDHYREIGRRGGRANVEKNGKEHMAEIGSRGGKAKSQDVSSS